MSSVRRVAVLLLALFTTRSNEPPLGRLWSAICRVGGAQNYDPRRQGESPDSRGWISLMNHFLFHFFLNHATCWLLWFMGPAAGGGFACGVQAWGRHAISEDFPVCELYAVSSSKTVKAPLISEKWGKTRHSGRVLHQAGCWWVQGCGINNRPIT